MQSTCSSPFSHFFVLLWHLVFWFFNWWHQNRTQYSWNSHTDAKSWGNIICWVSLNICIATSLKTFHFCELTFHCLSSISLHKVFTLTKCFFWSICKHSPSSQDFTALTVEFVSVYQVWSELAIYFFITNHLATYVAPENCIIAEFMISFLNTKSNRETRTSFPHAAQKPSWFIFSTFESLALTLFV